MPMLSFRYYIEVLLKLILTICVILSCDITSEFNVGM